MQMGRRRLAALEVSGEELQQRLDRPAAVDHRGRLAERRHHPVGAAQREDAAHLCRFLSLDGREGADPSLALQPDHPLVESAAEQHRAVQRPELVGGQGGLARGVERSLAVEDRQVLDLESRLEWSPGHGGSGLLPLYLRGRRHRRASVRRAPLPGR
jgi:hypothetical protein